MNLRTHLSSSNGYRELGMFDESLLFINLLKDCNRNEWNE